MFTDSMMSEDTDGSVELSPNEPSSEDAGSEASIDADQLDDLPGTKRNSEEELDVGEIFELLKNERRRRVIRFLQDQEDEQIQLSSLAEHIAALENDIDVVQLSSSQRKRVYIGLYQCHLPKMDDFGVVDFEKNRGIVTLRDTTQLEPYLREADGSEPTDVDAVADQSTEATEPAETGLSDDGRRVAMPVALTVVAVVAIGLTGIGPLAAVPAVFWTVVSLFALVFVASIRP